MCNAMYYDSFYIQALNFIVALNVTLQAKTEKALKLALRFSLVFERAVI